MMNTQYTDLITGALRARAEIAGLPIVIADNGVVLSVLDDELVVNFDIATPSGIVRKAISVPCSRLSGNITPDIHNDSSIVMAEICSVMELKPEVSASVPPAEAAEVSAEEAEEAFRTILAYIGENPQREGLLDTPKRFLKAWKEHWGAGYDISHRPELKVFKDGGKAYNEMIVVRNIKVYSHCEHHIAPFFGSADVAYIPREGVIVGLSKINRLVNFVSRRLQVQERITTEIAAELTKALNPLGVAVYLKCKHLCVCSRGIEDENSYTTTMKLTGAFLDNANKARDEFLGGVK